MRIVLDNIIITAVDEEVERYLRLHDLVDAIQSVKKHATVQTMSTVRFEHKDNTGAVYHCLACYHWGQPIASENGYTMVLIKGWSKRQAFEWFERYLNTLPDRIDVWVEKPERNN